MQISNITRHISNSRLKTALTLLLLVIVFWVADPTNIINILSEVQIRVFLLALVVVLFGVLISTLRWYLLLKTKASSVPVGTVFLLYYFGSFSNLGLPSSLGGDAVRSYLMGNYLSDSVDSYSSVIVDRFAGLIALILLSVTAISGSQLFTQTKYNTVLYVIVYATALGGLVLVVSLFSTKIYNIIIMITGDVRKRYYLPFDILEKIRSLYTSIHKYRSHPDTLINVLLLSIIFQVVSITSIYIISLSLNLDVSILYLFIVLPVVQLLITIPITINAYGSREVLYVYFFTQVGLTTAEAVTFSISVTILSFIAYLPGALAGYKINR
jgi:uncharacterized protein (TIRG00374 family)